MMNAPLKIVAVDDNSYTEEELALAFPDINPGVSPFGSRLVVQIRSVKNKTKGGIILTADSQESEKWNTQVAKVRRVGPLAYRNRETLEPWPEAAWCNEGDYVRVPKYLQDRWEVANGDSSVLFMIVNDLDILAKLECNPLEVKAYI